MYRSIGCYCWKCGGGICGNCAIEACKVGACNPYTHNPYSSNFSNYSSYSYGGLYPYNDCYGGFGGCINSYHLDPFACNPYDPCTPYYPHSYTTPYPCTGNHYYSPLNNFCWRKRRKRYF
ncbi:hypothetical protein MSU_0852 [Mycoplasma suis str. Illinois]|uniref:Uncharacterized protein n=1 Tax=Mycoplasma suis (strain Illinois) TaxID=768700 RepID=F0QS95_MYCSL|nr:hypothetical protein MSU_0852 [Mycoplasma suis str. Illinois]